MTIFHFLGRQKTKKSNHQKGDKFHQTMVNFYRGISKNSVKQHFWTTWTISGNFFFLIEVNLSKFPFFAKNHGKINVFAFFGIPKIQKWIFFIGFSTKMKWEKFQILHKNYENFFAFLATKKFKNRNFSMFFHKKWAVTPQKIKVFSNFVYKQKMKKS